MSFYPVPCPPIPRGRRDLSDMTGNGKLSHFCSSLKCLECYELLMGHIDQLGLHSCLFMHTELILVVNQTSASTAFFISWNKVDDDSEYSLIATQQGSSTETQKFTVYGESTFFFKDLNPNSTYCFTVAVMLDADTRGPESAPVCAQTGPIKK